MTRNLIVVEGLDNSGKNTWALKNHPNANIVDFPNRNGKYSAEIERFLKGELGYSPEVEDMFLENRLEWYDKNKEILSKGNIVFVRSGVSYLVYKWYRTGGSPK